MPAMVEHRIEPYPALSSFPELSYAVLIFWQRDLSVLRLCCASSSLVDTKAMKISIEAPKTVRKSVGWGCALLLSAPRPRPSPRLNAGSNG